MPPPLRHRSSPMSGAGIKGLPVISPGLATLGCGAERRPDLPSDTVLSPKKPREARDYPGAKDWKPVAAVRLLGPASWSLQWRRVAPANLERDRTSCVEYAVGIAFMTLTT